MKERWAFLGESVLLKTLFFLVCLLPAGLLLEAILFRVAPSGWVGQPASAFFFHFFQVLELLALGLLAYPLAKTVDSAQRLFGVGIMGLAGYIAYGFCWMALHLKLGTPPLRPEDCDQDNILAVAHSCQGRDFSFLEGRRKHFILRGTPRPDHCRDFLTKAVAPEQPPARCHLALPADWQRVDCTAYGQPASLRCFHCETRQGEWYQYLTAFSPDCLKIVVAKAINGPLPR